MTQKRVPVPGDPHVHLYESGKYTNGGGICADCGQFRVIFTAEELGQFCRVCGIPSFLDVPGGYVCDDHHPGKEFLDRANAMKVHDVGYDEYGNTWAMLIHAYGLAQEGKDARSTLWDPARS